MSLLTKIRDYLNRARKKEANLISGEQPLVAFVSSVMNNELNWARAQAKEHLEGLSGFIPWLFEYTPASSEDVKKGYLRKVRESDLVIWLIGTDTTNPVELEIREALSSERRLLAFLLPSKKRSEATENLIKEVGTRSKWVTVGQQSDFSDILEQSISDEVIRALRNKPGLSRLAQLKESLNASRARCLARWQAAGLSIDLAIELYEDLSIGNPPTRLNELLAKQSLAVLVGDYGIGKSLITERILQGSINKSIKDSSAPIPIYLESQEAASGLEECIRNHSHGLGNPRIQGATVIVDGIDETSISLSLQIVNQARILSKKWPNTSVIISSRGLPTLTDIEEAIKVEKLSEQDIQKLVSRVAGTDVTWGMIHALPDSVRDAVSRPFFSLLWGIYLRNRQNQFPETIGQLIEYLIEKSVSYSDNKIAKTLELLELIGAKTNDNRGAYTPWREICNAEDLSSLLETRLVEKDGDRIGFPLPILMQWFAAHSLTNKRVDITQIAKDLPRLDKWYYPLSIIVSLFPFDAVTEIISPVVENNPALAGEIIKEATSSFGYDTKIQLPTAKECAEKIRMTHEVWIKGLGGLAKITSPISPENELRSIGVMVSDNQLVVSWYHGKHKDGDIIELPVGYFGQHHIDQNWQGVRLATVSPQYSWPWRWSLEDLIRELDRSIHKRVFTIEGGSIYKETMWGYALEVLGYGELHSQPLRLDVLEPAVAKRLDLHGQISQWRRLQDYIKNLRMRGDTELSPPWPGPDIVTHRGGWIWEPYTEERVLNRTKAVYEAALEEYTSIIEKFFQPLKTRMLIATLLPAKIVGELSFIDTAYGDKTPNLDWYFEPLPIQKQSHTDLKLSGPKKTIDLWHLDWSKLTELCHNMRPHAREWISTTASSSGTEVFRTYPVTEIVYEWLRDDLKRIKWETF